MSLVSILALLSGVILLIADVWILIVIDKKDRKEFAGVIISGTVCALGGILNNIFGIL